MISSKPITRKWIVPAAGRNTIMEIINNDTYIWVTYISVRANRDNSGDISWRDEDGEMGGYIGPGEAALLGDDFGSQMGTFSFLGTAGDAMYLTIGISLGYPEVG